MLRPEAAPVLLQIEYVRRALEQNPVAQQVLDVAAAMDLPQWYLGASGVSQTVWNLRHGYGAGEGIKDYDVVYFDPDGERHTDRQLERELIDRVGIDGVELDVKNEARVHLWYEKRFGRHLEPYSSTEEALATWPTTASCVGVRRDADGFVVCAPFGLSDLIGMVARPNKAIVTQDVYEEKVVRWASRWPLLRVIPW
jgi:uncharacterized protein